MITLLKLVRSGCSSGPTHPSDSNEELYFGENDPGSCDTISTYMEIDTCNHVFLGGLTSSNSLIYGTPMASCNTHPRGYVSKITNGVI